MTEAERTAERLHHILEAIDGIQDTIAGLTKEIVMEQWTLRSAIERGLEIISEASRHIPDEIAARHPEIPWRNVRGIGNILRHDYPGVDRNVVWFAATEALDDLKLTARAMLSELEGCRDSPPTSPAPAR